MKRFCAKVVWSQGASQDIKADADVQRLLENPTVLISGVTGIGKTTYLTQVVMPACRELGLAPLFIALPEYFAVRDKLGDLPTFLREKIFGQVHTAAEQKDQFAHELAAAIFQQSVIWLLDGFDELTPRERGLLIQELERLKRFALTTRQVKPEALRPSDATVHLTNVEYRHALEYIGTRYSPQTRSRIEQWCERQYEARDVLMAGWWLEQTAELARTRPMNQYVTPKDFSRAQAAQSAASGILGRPIVLANEALLRRIPADVIHSLMADLHLRIRKTGSRVTVITSDGHSWTMRSD